MTLEERIIGDVTVVSVKGDITLSKGGDQLLKDKVQSVLQQGRRKLVLNLADVSYVDSAGLGQLVQAHSTAQNLGGTLKLANVEKRLRDLLVVTKLVTVFDSHDSEAAAVDSFVSA
jgi:anti-sigma B factor antagonist